MHDYNEYMQMYDYYMREAEKVCYLDEESNLAYHKHCLWIADNYRRWLEVLA